MNLHADDAIILHHLDYGEADRIVTFLTATHGVRKGFARNARSSRKRFGAALESFARVRLQWSAPRHGELLSLREADLLDLRVGLRSELGSIALAAYGCELVEALFGDAHGHPELFDLLNAFLDHLAGHGPAPESRLLLELRLLYAAGYIPHLLHCAECNGRLKEQVPFDPARGGSLCPACAGGAPFTVALPTLGTLARSLPTPLTAFAGFRFGERTLSEGGRLLGSAIRLHLNRPLKTLEFLESVRLPGGDFPTMRPVNGRCI